MARVVSYEELEDLGVSREEIADMRAASEHVAKTGTLPLASSTQTHYGKAQEKLVSTTAKFP